MRAIDDRRPRRHRPSRDLVIRSPRPRVLGDLALVVVYATGTRPQKTSTQLSDRESRLERLTGEKRHPVDGAVAR